MTDQQNYEATRPVSADPAVALAQALGQLPKESPKQPKELPKHLAKAPAAELQLVAKTSVEDLAQELGLKLGDQNELTIRRIKRGKSYSFIRANGTRIRHAGTMPPGGCNIAITPIGRRCASSARRIAWPNWSRHCRRSDGTSICIWPATSRRESLRCRR
jgi:hypothetical protein